ncbi:protein of unknown function [Catalinimonas alkaloidigena]|uniref:DUF1573 domain-containing protein n=1 Tax=Catalinimonas alkaloidigena TaxID=1075417 RepID=A0A1G9KT94_9BACT|nr:DUF1573 domain-containing protein [Catalinimonas alkaloidigena]SDL52829.1 protein of unknown function [Catalinimonas alkaloidigena]
MRTFFAFFLLLWSGSVWAQYPTMQVTDLTYDFGTIQEVDGPQVARFPFANTGSGPLYILDVEEDCTCMEVRFPRKPIAPGEEGVIEVTFSPRGRPGGFNRPLIVNSTADPVRRLFHIKGNVIPRERTVEDYFPDKLGNVRIYSRYLNLGMVPKTGQKESTFRIFNQSNDTIRFQPVPPGVIPAKISVTPQALAPNDTGFVHVVFDGTKREGYGYFNYSLTLPYREGDQYNYLPLFVLGSIEDEARDMTPEEAKRHAHLELDQMTQPLAEGAPATFQLKNTGSKPLKIHQIRTNCACLTPKVTSQEVAPGQSTTLSVTMNEAPEASARSYSVVLYTNDPTTPTQRLTLKAQPNN